MKRKGKGKCGAKDDKEETKSDKEGKAKGSESSRDGKKASSGEKESVRESPSMKKRKKKNQV